MPYSQDSNNSAVQGPGRLQAIAAGGWLPNGTIGNNQYGRYDTRAQGRRLIRTGASAISQIVLGFCGFYEKNATGETLIGNDYDVEAVIEYISPSAFQRAMVANQAVAAVPNGTQLVLSNPVEFDLAGDSDFYTRCSYSVPYGTMNLPGNQSQNARTGDSYDFSTNSPSQVAATGNIIAPTGGVNYLCCGLPYLILGIPATPMACVIIHGDSIGDGYKDGNPNGGGDGNGNSGFLQRGLYSVNGHAIPATRQTVGGDQLSFNQENTGSMKRAAWQYHTHFINEMLTNDIATQATAGVATATIVSSCQAMLTALWTAAKRTIGPYGKPLNVTQTLCMPRTTSTDSWATAANQTPVAGFAVGGARDQINAWIKSQVGLGLLDSYIDPNQYVEDQANKGCWITNGTASYPTTDGIHPTPATYILAAQAVTAWAQTITV